MGYMVVDVGIILKYIFSVPTTSIPARETHSTSYPTVTVIYFFRAEWTAVWLTPVSSIYCPI
jgi:hypothetical protein